VGNEVYLKNIANISAGSSAPKEDYLDTEGVPFIRAGNLEELINGVDINTLAKINEKHRDKLKLKKVSENSILFAKSGMSSMKNRVYKVEKESYFVNHLACVTVKDKNVDVDYLKYFFEWFKPSSLVRDESYPSIRLSDISNIKINLPSIKIQEKVAATLNETNKVLKLRQQQIEALSALKQSIFLDMFGDPILNTKNWEIVKLSDIGKWQSGGTPSRKKKEYYEGEIPWLSSGELNNIYTSNSNEYITKNAIEESSAKLIAKNSLLLGMYDTAGLKSSINLVECSCNQAIAFAKIDEKYAVTEFVYYTIQIMREYLLNQQRGVRQKNFNLTMIKNIEIISPPVELQQKFLDKVIIVFDKEKELERSLVLIKGLFNSTLHKAFNGELFKEEIKV